MGILFLAVYIGVIKLNTIHTNELVCSRFQRGHEDGKLVSPPSVFCALVQTALTEQHSGG